MAEGVNQRDDPHERIDGLERRFFQALNEHRHYALEGRVAEVERLVKCDEAARDRHHLWHGKIDRRLDDLEKRAAQHDHAHDIASSLREAPETEINARISVMTQRLAGLEARLASKPDDFGGVTSTGAPKTMTRWVIVSKMGSIFSAYAGLVDRKDAAKFIDKSPKFFLCENDAATARDLIFFKHYCVEEVEVIERDGRLIEARYA